MARRPGRHHRGQKARVPNVGFNPLVTTTNPMRQIAKRMNAALNLADLAALPVLFVLEVTRSNGRPHLHGVFISNGISISRIQKVIRQAVGYVAGHSGSRQFMSCNMYDPDGWAKYIQKDLKHTRRLLKLSNDERLTWVSRPMTQFARDQYKAVRLGRMNTSNFNAKPILQAS